MLGLYILIMLLTNNISLFATIVCFFIICTEKEKEDPTSTVTICLLIMLLILGSVSSLWVVVGCFIIGKLWYD